MEVECPLCEQNLISDIQLRQHLGRHRELSLFALPTHVEDLYYDSDDEQASNDNRSFPSSKVHRRSLPLGREYVSCYSRDTEFRGDDRYDALQSHMQESHVVMFTRHGKVLPGEELLRMDTQDDKDIALVSE
jgi:hypothetical protein